MSAKRRVGSISNIDFEEALQDCLALYDKESIDFLGFSFMEKRKHRLSLKYIKIGHRKNRNSIF